MWCYRPINKFLPIAVLCLIAACDSGSPALTARGVGDPFPSLVLKDLDGGEVTLSRYRGKVLVLNLWATWCPPCRRELPSLDKLAQVLDPQRFVVVGLSVDEEAHIVREYLLDKGVTFPTLLDPLGEQIEEKLEIAGFPDTFVIGRNGILLGRVGGERVWHTPETVRVLEQAYAGEVVSLVE